LTDISFLSLYPDKATRVKYEIASLTKAGYSVEVRKPFINSSPVRPLTLLLRYITLLIQGLLARGRIIHFSNIPDFNALSVLLRRNKFVYDVRTGFATNMYYYTKSVLIWKLAIGIEKILYRRADVTITANKYLAMRARKLGARNVIVVPNYPLSTMEVKVPKEEIRAGEGCGENDKIFLIISNLTKLKPFELLFTEFTKILESYPTSQLWIVGEGNDKNRLEKIAKKLSPQIKFFGYKKIDELGSIINASDVCLAVYEDLDPRFQQFYSEESVWKTGEYALFEKPIVALNMVPDKGLICANKENLAEKMIFALQDNAHLLEKKTWKDSERILLDVYKQLES